MSIVQRTFLRPKNFDEALKHFDFSIPEPELTHKYRNDENSYLTLRFHGPIRTLSDSCRFKITSDLVGI